MIWIVRDATGTPVEAVVGRRLRTAWTQDWSAKALTWQQEPATAWTQQRQPSVFHRPPATPPKGRT